MSTSRQHHPYSHRRRRARRGRRPVLIVCGFAAALLVAGGLAFWLWNRPLGPRLSTTQPGEGGVLPAPQAQPPESGDRLGPQAQPQCGGPPTMLILLIGSDAEEDTVNRSFADVIRLARVDFVNASVAMLPIPRDLWVPIPGMQVIGVAENRLSTAYAYGNRYRGLGGGPILLAETLYQEFGLQADYYVAVNFSAFAAGIDAIGGVDLYMPEAVDGTQEGLSYIPAGWNHLDGRTALHFARARPDNTSDLARIERQTELIRAIQQKVVSPQVLPSVPRLARSMRDSVLTDLSPAEVSMLLCLGQQLGGGDIQSVEMDSSLYASITDEHGYQRLLPDRAGIAAFLRAFHAGELSPTPASLTSLPSP